MALTQDTRKRRWLGGATLAAALAMLLVGETLLKGRLSAPAMLLYWLVCFVLTGAAILVAFIDARMVARKTLTEQRELFDATLKQIQAEARSRQTPPASSGETGAPLRNGNGAFPHRSSSPPRA